MIYLDTSCLLKLLWEEPESEAVRMAINDEEIVIVSSLSELEAETQLKAAAIGDDPRKPVAALSGHVCGNAKSRSISFQVFASGGVFDRVKTAPTSSGSLLPHIGPASSGGDGGIKIDAANDT